MTESDSSGARAAADAPIPRRSRLLTLVPLAVVVCTAALLIWNAWPAVRPAQEVSVTQAVFDRAAEAATQPDRSAGVRTAPVSSVTVQAPGWLEAEPYFVACTALADGIVETIEVLEGDRVEAGQVVARLVADDSLLRLRRADAELAAARAELNAAEAELAAAQTDWDEPVDRTRAVETSRAALAEQKADLARLPSLIDAARATLEQYREELSRVERSLAGQAATEFEAIVARQRHKAQEAVVRSLEAEKPLLQAGVDGFAAELRAAERGLELRVEERRRLAQALALVERAKAAVARTSVNRDEAALEHERMTILAPIEGFVQSRLKAPGDKVVRMMDDPDSAHIAHLYDPERLQVRVDVPLADASHVFEGQPCEIVVEVLPDRVFEGRVLRITHEADLQKNTLQVKVGLTDPSPLLRPEMLSRVKFLPAASLESGAAPAESEQTVLVPDDSLREIGGAFRVWTVKDRQGSRGVARAIPVEVRARQNGWATVSGAINPGDLLILGDLPLSEGDLVRITPDTNGERS